MAGNIVRIGVLSLQGDFDKHIKALTRAGADARLVRTPEEIADIDGLIIPGGESTTVGILLEKTGCGDSILKRAAERMPIYGTCTGMILMANSIEEGRPDQYRLNLLYISVRRNAYGRQIDSFEAYIDIPSLSIESFHAIFIRAPQVTRVGDDVEILSEHNNIPVLLKQDNFLVSSFHPELTEDVRLHEYFIRLVAENRQCPI